ncbi:MAG: site-specific integrase [Candidatus Thermoplasmatota archaeon]
MTWNSTLPKADAPAREVWNTNQDVMAAWSRHVGRRGAKNTQRNLLVYVRVFIANFEHMVTQLDTPDIDAFIAKISSKCSKLMNGSAPQCLAGEEISACPLLTGAAPYASCQGYRSLDPSGVWSYICAINRFYEWLVEEGRIARNPALVVMRDFASKHSALFDERRRKPRRRTLDLKAVKKLVDGSPIHRAIGYLLMAKCFLRIHEVLKLRIDKDHFSLDEGWMDIPADRELGDKRKGNKRIVLDAEARRWVRLYLMWRSDHVKRNDDGTDGTPQLLITSFGRPWGKAAIHNFNTALHADAVRLGLMTGEETERSERVNSHCFRAFSTTYARAHGIGHADLMLLRGDLSPGAIERYDDYLSRLPRLYTSYAPVLGLSIP